MTELEKLQKKLSLVRKLLNGGFVEISPEDEAFLLGWEAQLVVEIEIEIAAEAHRKISKNPSPKPPES